MKRYTNTIKSLVLLLFAGMGMASCGDFLEIEPKTFVSEDNFWNEKTDIDQMVAGTYVKMQNADVISRCIMWGETRSDNIVEGNECSGQTNIYRTLKENLLSTNVYSKWGSFYSVINQCNTIIDEAPKVSEKDPEYTESDVRATQAEMACLRDLCYFYLVRAFKDVPYYTYPIQSSDMAVAIPASSGDSIVKCLIEDLEGQVSYALKAYPKDSNSKYNSSCNRITQNAIYALLADLCLWDGQYSKTVEYSQKVIDSKYQEYLEKYSKSKGGSGSTVVLFHNEKDTYSEGYPLYPCFSGNSFGNDFNQIFGGDQNSFESIFELAFTYDGTDKNYISNTACASLYGNHYSSGGNDGKGYLACNDNISGDITSSTSSGQVFDHAYDVRFYANLYNPAAKSGESSSSYSAKYVSSSVDVSTSTGSGSTLPYSADFTNNIYANRNFIFYRLTDVMLMQAEALIQLGGDAVYTDETDENGNTKQVADDNLLHAFYLIWTVNRRSIMTNSAKDESSYELSLSKNNFKSLLLSTLLKERRREFMFEGKRWFDLLRQCHREGTTSYIKNNVSAKGSSSGSTSLFTNYEALFWPYNKDEVKNNSLLSQKSYYGNDDDEDSFKSTK